MLYSRNVLIRALGVIEAKGYVSKERSLIEDIESTKTTVEHTLSLNDVTDREIALYGKQADTMIVWAANVKSTDDKNFIQNLHRALKYATPNDTGYFSYICALPQMYWNHLNWIKGLEHVTAPLGFAGLQSEMMTVPVKIVNIECLPKGYIRVAMVDNIGYLITCNISNKRKKLLTGINVNDTVMVTGKVYKQKYTKPNETVLSYVSFEK
jgi:hypothetical protein